MKPVALPMATYSTPSKREPGVPGGGFPRRRFLVLGCGLALTGAFRGRFAGVQAAEPSTAAGVFADVREGVGTFSARGGTMGILVADDALVVVDSQFTETARECLAGLRRKSTRRIDALFNTHHHADHTGGNGVFRGETGKIVAHQNVPGLQRAAAGSGSAGAEAVTADVTFATEFRLEVGRERVVATHYGPAHTGGDSVIRFERANVAHMGDLVFNRRHPFIDRPGGASIRNWIATLEKVSADYPADTRYIFGHAGDGWPLVGERADLQAMRDYLAALMDAAETAVKRGVPREEFVKGALPAAFAVYDPKNPRGNTNPRFGLPANLGVAYDEALTTK